MILRILWFGGVFCAFALIGAHRGDYAIGVRPPDPTAVTSAISRPFNELVDALNGHH